MTTRAALLGVVGGALLVLACWRPAPRICDHGPRAIDRFDCFYPVAAGCLVACTGEEGWP